MTIPLPQQQVLPPDIPVVQCAMNVSEGRRLDVLDGIVSAVTPEPRLVIADASADPDHNRAVLSLLGEPEAVLRAVVAIAGRAVEMLDLRQHAGAHPRTGVVDVVPFTPIRAINMEACRELALRCAHRLATNLGIAVYLYGEATRTGRPSALPALRRILSASGSGLPNYQALEPDFGDSVEPSRGASMVGARPPLVAYNVFLARGGLREARRIAAAIRAARASTAEVAGVRALGLYLPSRGTAQVSMNVTRPHETPLPGVFRAVEVFAAMHGAAADFGEVIGLVPRAALGDRQPGDRGVEVLTATQVVEYWLGTT